MQFKPPKLNFPPINVPLRESQGVIQLYDALRRCYIVLTPEEWVRRHVIAFLVNQMATPPAQIIVEYPVLLNGQRQRADIVVVNSQGEPQLLCECKTHDVKITQAVMDQAVRYNYILKARYILLTNGMTHHLYERVDGEGGYRPLSSFDDIQI